MKALVILSHSLSQFLPPICYMENVNFCGSIYGLLEYFREKKSPWIDYPCKAYDYDDQWTKENVNIKLLDLCESLIVYILLST